MTTSARDTAPAPRATRRRLRIERFDAAATATVWHRGVAVMVGLLLSVVFLVTQTDVGGMLFPLVWDSTFGSTAGVSHVLQLAAPLVVAGCAVTLARRIGLWNVGVEGQLVMGAFMATVVAFWLPDWPSFVLVPLMLLAGLVGGGIYAAVPGIARAYFNVNELISGLMLNFAAFFWLAYWVVGPWGQQGSAQVLSSKLITENARWPALEIGGLHLRFGVLFAIALAILLAAAARHTHYGFRMALGGSDDRTAAYTGTNIRRLRMQVYVLSGAIGGLVGVLVELDTIHRFSAALSFDTGYLGIVVAVVAASSPLACIPAGVLIAFLVASADSLRLAGVPFDIVLFLSGLVLLLTAGADVLARYRVTLVSRPAAGEAQPSPTSEATP